MARSSFEMGEKEKHTLTVDRDRVMKKTRIELDGEKLADEYYYSPLAKNWCFGAGISEVHKVEVGLGLTSHKGKVLVDGKPARRSTA
ncbi:MAG: hypothetical protein ABSF83_10435 [Nitrososphaerales archaeon]|jgi:hypothetical protein